MSVLLDHLTAVLVGAILIGALLALQLRDRLDTVERSVNDAARVRVETVRTLLAQDTDNLLTVAQTEAFLGGPSRTRLVRVDSQTTVYELATIVRDSVGGADAPGYVRYELDATGDSAQVGEAWLPLHALRRRVDRGAGYDAGTVLSDRVAHFAVGFGNGGSTPGAAGTATAFQTTGAATDALSQVEFTVALAAQATAARRAADQRASRETSLVRAGSTLRPQNLGPAR